MSKAGSTILLIEDDPTYIHVLEYEFSAMGWTIETVNSADNARKYLQNNQPEIIVSDVKLPDGSGIDLSQEFKSISPNSLTILITGYPNLKDSIRALQGQVYDYLLKPFKIEQLILVIERARFMYKLKQKYNLLKLENKKLKKILIDKGVKIDDLFSKEINLNISSKTESSIEMYARQVRRSGGPEPLDENNRVENQISDQRKE